MSPETYTTVWLSVATRKILKCTDSGHLRGIAALLRGIAELADQRAAKLEMPQESGTFSSTSYIQARSNKKNG